MKLRTVGYGVLLPILAALALVVGANPAGALTQPVSFSATGTGNFGGTLGFVTDVTYTSSGPLGSGTIHTDVSLTPGGPGFVTSGTAVLTRNDGATLSGTTTGTVNLSSFPFLVEFTLALTTGTGAFAGASADLDGTTMSLGPGSVDTFTITGVLTTPTPTEKADCKRGGWRTLANDQGQPFRNQGQCVKSVVAHRS
jgi:hypothetical protein